MVERGLDRRVRWAGLIACGKKKIAQRNGMSENRFKMGAKEVGIVFVGKLISNNVIIWRMWVDGNKMRHEMIYIWL
jgi:hypothetical protein